MVSPDWFVPRTNYPTRTVRSRTPSDLGQAVYRRSRGWSLRPRPPPQVGRDRWEGKRCMSGQLRLSPVEVTALEEEAALRALGSGWVIPLWPEDDAFEQEFSYGARANCVAVSSGTVAFHLELLALGVRPLIVTFLVRSHAITCAGVRTRTCGRRTANCSAVSALRRRRGKRAKPRRTANVGQCSDRRYEVWSGPDICEGLSRSAWPRLENVLDCVAQVGVKS